MPRILKIAAIASLGVVAQASACSIENATYAYSTDKNITAQFENKGHGWISPLVLYVKLGPGKPTYWFLFDQGTARYTSLISTTDVDAPQWSPPSEGSGESPLGSMNYFSWGSNLRVNESVPQPHDTAPDFIFLPDLPEKLWYVARPRVSIAPGIFTLKSCS